MLYDWQKLERDDAEKMIGAVRSAADAMLFSISSSEVTSSTLPFYNVLKAFRLSNYASLPVFSMDFLSDGTDYIYLDGSLEALVEANERDGMRLSPRNVLMYLDFYFKNVLQDDGEIHTYHPETEQLQTGLHLSAPQITYRPDDFSYMVQCPLYVDGAVMSAQIFVSAKGEVRIESMHPYLTDAASAFNSSSTVMR